MFTGRPNGSRFVARFAPFALALLLPGLAELHAPGSEHSAAAEAVGAGAVYFPAAEHPNQPLHVEPAREAAHEPCSACLHRLETRGGSTAAHEATAAPEGVGSLSPGLPPARHAGISSPASGRAPPRPLL